MAPQPTNRMPPGNWTIGLVESIREKEHQCLVRLLEPADLQTPVVFDPTSMLGYISLSFRHRVPVGMRLSADNGLVEVGTLHCSIVQSIEVSTRYDEVMSIEFPDQQQPKFLQMRQPRFAEILLLLRGSLSTRNAIWYIVQGRTLVEAFTLSTAEEVQLRSWQREPNHPRTIAETIPNLATT